MRDKIIEELCKSVEIGKEARKIIDEYATHKDLVDDLDFQQYPLYALLTIMATSKRWVTILGRKNILDNGMSYGLMDRYLLCEKFAKEYRIAGNELEKHLNNVELNMELDEQREKIFNLTAITYDSNISFMVDIFDTNSRLYDIEGIGFEKTK